MSTRTLDQKLGDWNRAFNVVREDITPPKMRAILDEMKKVDGVDQLMSYMQLAGQVMANDRTAATVASTLIASGVRDPHDDGA